MGYTHANYLRLGVAAPTPHAPISHGKQASLPQSRCTVHAQGVKSWGVRFIWREFCLDAQATDRPPSCTANEARTTVCFIADGSGSSD